MRTNDEKLFAHTRFRQRVKRVDDDGGCPAHAQSAIEPSLRLQGCLESAQAFGSTCLALGELVVDLARRVAEWAKRSLSALFARTNQVLASGLGAPEHKPAHLCGLRLSPRQCTEGGGGVNLLAQLRGS